MSSWLLLLPLLLLPLSQAILNGSPSEWKHHAYLVKVLSRDSDRPSSVIGCSGSLLTPRLIITSTDCLIVHGKRLDEVLVSIPRPGHLHLHKRAEIVETNSSMAVLRLYSPIPVSQLCPSRQASLPFARLPLTPSLTQPSITHFDYDHIDNAACRMIGFVSMEEASKFPFSREVATAPVTGVEVGEEEITLKRTTVSQPAPCYEDLGAPLECLMGEKYVQVGMFLSLMAAKEEAGGSSTTTVPSSSSSTPNSTARNEEKPSLLSRCLSSPSMRFLRLEVSLLASIIQRYDFTGFVQAYEQCDTVDSD